MQIQNSNPMDLALVITAIVSLIGVSIAAILNYRSSIVVANKRIKFDEHKIKYDFMLESFTKLKDALNKLESQKLFTDSRDQTKYANSITDNGNESQNIFRSICIYLPKEKTAELNNEYEKLDSAASKVLNRNGFIDNSLPAEDKKICIEVMKDKWKLSHKVRTSIEDELAILIEKLRDYKLV